MSTTQAIESHSWKGTIAGNADATAAMPAATDTDTVST